MGKIISFVSSHKRELLAGIAIVITVAMLILIARCTVFKEKKQPQSPAPQATCAPDVSDLQKTLIARYSTQEREFTETLKAYLWVSQTTGHAVEFGDNAYLVAGDGKEPVWKPFAVAALFGQDIVKAVQGSSDTLEPCICAALLSDTKTKIFTIVPVVAGEKKTLVMTTDAFGNKLSYTAQQRREDIRFEGFTDEVNRVLEKDTKELKDAVTNHIKATFPTASTATLATKITFDFSSDRVSLLFALDDVRKSKIPVMWHRTNNRVDFSRGGG